MLAEPELIEKGKPVYDKKKEKRNRKESVV